jgi:hypothetical protein
MINWGSVNLRFKICVLLGVYLDRLVNYKVMIVLS